MLLIQLIIVLLLPKLFIESSYPGLDSDELATKRVESGEFITSPMIVKQNFLTTRTDLKLKFVNSVFVKSTLQPVSCLRIHRCLALDPKMHRC